MMAFASKLGAGAAKAGKKAAQSEAGRRATRAAIKGSMDAVRDDMVSRYSEEPNTPTSPTQKEISEKERKTSATSSGGVKEKEKEQSNSIPSWMEDDSDEDEPVSYSYREPEHRAPPKHTAQSNPPKPSFFDKFRSSGSSTSASKPRPRPAQKDPKDRVFNHRLAKKPDWDSLPMAQALYHYKAEMKCDLEFRKGQMIYVITRTDTQNDWWEGKLEGRVGIFPANYVKVLN